MTGENSHQNMDGSSTDKCASPSNSAMRTYPKSIPHKQPNVSGNTGHNKYTEITYTTIQCLILLDITHLHKRMIHEANNAKGRL